jgi:hypothetical protein
MAICAYCDRDGRVTREELFPRFLARRSPGYGTFIDHSRPNRPLHAVPVVRDVCAKCNNESLGALDAYADQLAAKYFSSFVDEPVQVKFECDTNLLMRWLLKLLFNEARASGRPIDTYKHLRPFILGGQATPWLPIHLLVGVVAPVRLRDGGLEYPEHHGFADIHVNPPLRDWAAFSRGVFLNSYFFHVLGWRNGLSKTERKRILAQLAEAHGYVELHRPRCSVQITKAFANTLALAAGTFAGAFQLT